MKKYLLIIILFGFLKISAQENITVKMTQLAIDSSMQPAFVVEIPQAESKNAIKLWEERLVPKNFFSAFQKNPKMEKEDKDKWFIHGVVIDEICPDTMSIYTRINSFKDWISFSTLFKTPTGYIGTDTTNHALNDRAKAYLRSHAVDVYKMAVQEELDDLEKELKKMENNFTGYDKDNKKLDRKSDESESNLSVMKAHATDASAGVLSEEQMKAKLKEIKKEEKALKKYEKKMDRNSSKQKKLAREIQKMEEQIKAVQKKLINIK